MNDLDPILATTVSDSHPARQSTSSPIHATVTASGRTQLRAQTVSTLRAYLKAYGLSVPANVLEKEEIVDAVLAARVRAVFVHIG